MNQIEKLRLPEIQAYGYTGKIKLISEYVFQIIPVGLRYQLRIIAEKTECRWSRLSLRAILNPYLFCLNRRRLIPPNRFFDDLIKLGC